MRHRPNLLCIALMVSPYGLAVSKVLAQVSVKLDSQTQTMGRAFTVHVENRRHTPISVCVDIGMEVYGKDGPTPAPHPFNLQLRTAKGWATQLIGTDVGNEEVVDPLANDMTTDFLIQVNHPGTYRLQMQYSRDQTLKECRFPLPESKTVSSSSFVVQAAPKE